ncbi:MAG: T9SS type A sorting domain-containing protein [Ignavibacteria bacterium]|nr:T9SS type A sorting domain-containing protein [Ignavibacteria bacterium]
MKKSASIVIKIFDSAGKEIFTLIDEFLNSGRYEINYNAFELSSGIYFYSLFANNNKINTKKLLFIK